MLKITSVVALLAAVAVAATAYAGSPNRSTSSIALVKPAAATTSDSTFPAYTDNVTFDVSTNAVKQPFVHLKCWQGRTLVLESWQAWFFLADGSQTFNLGPTPNWTGGAADCTAYLENWDSYSKNGKIATLASTSFDVGA